MTARVTDLLPAAGDWRALALCQQVDNEIFFPDKGGSTREAKQVCAACEVQPQCLEFALRNDERFGIWGGWSERERRRLKRTAAAAPELAGDEPAEQVPDSVAGSGQVSR